MGKKSRREEEEAALLPTGWFREGRQLLGPSKKVYLNEANELVIDDDSEVQGGGVTIPAEVARMALGKEKLYVLYDGRAKEGSTDDATVLVSARSIKDALVDDNDFREYDRVWFVYDCEGKKLVNERRISDIRKERP